MILPGAADAAVPSRVVEPHNYSLVVQAGWVNFEGVYDDPQASQYACDA
jgi:hypothetical protein